MSSRGILYDKIRGMTSPEATSSETSRNPKIFVLDTSVILYDANAIFNFKEHDVAIPITVLEELDHFKKGDTVINLQAREFIRQLDKLTSHDMLNNWVPLDGPELGYYVWKRYIEHQVQSGWKNCKT